jgi:hypothetical protein
MYYLQTEDYRIISSSVVLGAFKDSDSLSMKTYLMAEVVNFFLGITTITGIEDVFSGMVNMNVEAYPNPFTDKINLTFGLDNASQVTVRIFDESGRLVNNLFDGELGSGNHSFVWAGNTSSGLQVNNGVSFYSVNVNGKAASGKILFSR